AGVFFCVQAEDGIRDFHVTGVQTCALPISGPPRPSVSVEMAGPGPAGQDGSGRADRRVTLEAIGPLLRCSSVELSTLRSAAGTIRPHLGDLIRRLSDPTLRITGS